MWSACRGSNFLLNIGPTPEGTFPPEDQVRLHELGVWMQVNGEAIYQTEGAPFAREHPWGSLTYNNSSNTVYLHLLDWRGGDIEVKGITTRGVKATFLDTGEPLKMSQDSSGARIREHRNSRLLRCSNEGIGLIRYFPGFQKF